MQRDTITMLVAHNIEALMEQKGLDAAKLARAAGLNPTGIYDILSGKSRSPKIETVNKIARGLNVPLAHLFQDAPEREMTSEILSIYSDLSEDRRDLLLQTARAWIAQQEG